MRRAELLFLFAAVVALLASAAGWMGKLGVEYDEAHFLPAAVKLARGSPELLRPPAGLYVAHRPVPFMTMAYVGGIDVPIYAAAYALFGTGPLVHRVVNLLLGVLVLLLAYALARRLHSPLAGVFAVILLLVDLEFLLHVPTNFGPFLLQMLCAAGGVWLLAAWWEGRQGKYLPAAAALLGLGVQEKLTFFCVIAAIFAGCLVYAKSVWRACRWYSPLAAGLVFALAMSPVIWYAWGFPQVVFGYAKSSAGVANAGDKIQQLRLLLDGQFTPGFLLGNAAPPFARYSYLSLLWLLAFASLVIFRRSAPRAAWFGVWFTLALFGCNLLFPEAGRLHHFLLLYPIFQVGLGATLAWWWQSKWLRLPITLLLGLSAASSAQHLVWFQGEVARTGGGKHWSAEINQLVRWAEARPRLHFYTGSWGLARQLMTFPATTLSVHERYFQLVADRDAELKLSAPRRDAVWLFSSVLPVYEEQRDRFLACARRMGYQPRLIARIGTLYQAYALLPEEDTKRFRVAVSGDWAKAESLRAELLDQEGHLVESYFRPFEYFPPMEQELTLEFGASLYPDYFLPLQRNPGQVASLRVTASGPTPLTVRDVASQR
ncbi:MAG: glycosyltransferase family 39 protein [Bryobacteraceae bacterium]|nr:glycosyltransferase family 39 protein [Bryobacteraceae bacterium]